MIGNDTINNGNSLTIWLVVVVEITNEISLSLNIRSAMDRSMGIPQFFLTKISSFSMKISSFSEILILSTVFLKNYH